VRKYQAVRKWDSDHYLILSGPALPMTQANSCDHHINSALTECGRPAVDRPSEKLALCARARRPHPNSAKSQKARWNRCKWTRQPSSEASGPGAPISHRWNLCVQPAHPLTSGPQSPAHRFVRNHSLALERRQPPELSLDDYWKKNIAHRRFMRPTCAHRSTQAGLFLLRRKIPIYTSRVICLPASADNQVTQSSSRGSLPPGTASIITLPCASRSKRGVLKDTCLRCAITTNPRRNGPAARAPRILPGVASTTSRAHPHKNFHAATSRISTKDRIEKLTGQSWVLHPQRIVVLEKDATIRDARCI